MRLDLTSAHDAFMRLSDRTTKEYASACLQLYDDDLDAAVAAYLAPNTSSSALPVGVVLA